MVVLLPAQDVTFALTVGDTVRVRGVDWTVARSDGVRRISAGSADALLLVKAER